MKYIQIIDEIQVFTVSSQEFQKDNHYVLRQEETGMITCVIVQQNLQKE